MQFSSYHAFRTAVQQLIDGDDVSQSDLSVEVLDLLIGAGERQLYRQVRSSAMDTTYSQTVTANVMALPTGFLEFRGAPYLSTFKSATYAPYEEVQNLIQIGARQAAHPVRYTFASDTVIFYPVQDGITVSGQYYQKFADISTGLNAFFTRHPDLFIYAALAHSAPFLGEMTRLPVWKEMYAELLTAANEEERRRYTRGGKLQTRVA